MGGERLHLFGDYVLDTARGSLLRSGHPVHLRPQAYRALKFLAENRGRLISKDRLVEEIWEGRAVTDDSLVKCLRDVRQALGEGARLLRTEHGRGYILEPEGDRNHGLEDNPLWTEQVDMVSVVVEDEEGAAGPAIGIEQPPSRRAVLTVGASGAKAEQAASRAKRHRRRALLVSAALVVATAAVALAYFTKYFGGRPEAITSIAVLPFVNEGADPDTEYLSDGLSESLINSLSQLPSLKVIARSSAFRYKGKDADPQEVAAALGVQAILVGRVAQRGDSLVVSAELVDAKDRTQVWGERYERKVADLLSVQREIAKEITENLRLKLSGAEQGRVAKSYTENPEAYQLYLKGRFYWNKRTEEGVRKGIEFFQRAVEKDPNFALAYVGISDSYILLGVPEALTGAMPTREALAAARSAAERALAIDGTLAEAHTSLAHAMYIGREWTGAEEEHRRGIALNPNYATAHHFYALYLSYLGRHDEALREIRRALELDPLSLIINANLGSILHFAGRYEEAAEQCRRTLDMDPTFAFAHYRLGTVYEQNGMYEEAVAEFRRAADYSQQHPTALAALAHTLAVSGNKSEAQKVLGTLTGLSGRRHVSAYDVAVVYIGLAEKEQAFRWLERAVEQGDYVNRPKIDPRLAPLRPDPRFATLLRRLGLEP
jgi:TolB-like protein/DNA-binding winged helix-turn-helix (wHTH) protein/Tfp pilus assembly protein PilF